MTLPEKIVKNACRRLGAPYRFGAERKPLDNPLAPIDCSELIEMAVREAGRHIPDGSWIQASYCVKVPYMKAKATPGALCFVRRFRKFGRVVHVGMSLGDGRVIEASSRSKKVIIHQMSSRDWDLYGLIPGVHTVG